MIFLLPLLVIWGFFILYGLTYLLVESDLLERPRKWCTSTVQSPEDAAIAALLAESTAERPLPQVEPQAPTQFVPPPDSQFVPPPAATVSAIVPQEAEHVVPQFAPPPANRFAPPPAKPSCLRVFIGRILSCWACTSGWVAPVTAGLVVLFALALHHEAYWAIAVLSVFMIPPTGIGFTMMMDHLSPKRASESIVNAMTDIAQAVLDAKFAEQPPRREAFSRRTSAEA